MPVIDSDKSQASKLSNSKHEVNLLEGHWCRLAQKRSDLKPPSQACHHSVCTFHKGKNKFYT